MREGGDSTPDVVAVDGNPSGRARSAPISRRSSPGALRKGDFPAGDVAALDETVFAAYVDGLRDLGWDGDSRVVRLGYVMSLALRCWLVRDAFRNLGDPGVRPLFGRAPDVPPGDVRVAFATLSRFLTDRTDEARDLTASSAVAIPQRPVR